jgi:hypothetical protein
MIQSVLLSKYPYIFHEFTVKGKKETVVVPKQTHSDNVLTISDRDYHNTLSADGLVTGITNMPIGIVTADCIPLLLLETQKRIIAAVHCGWRGILRNIAGKALSTIVKMGGSSSAVIAALGPSIGQCCYSVPEDRAQKILSKYGSENILSTNNKTYLNLPKIVVYQLEEAGVSPEAIDVIDHCTYCSKNNMYSYRRGDIVKRMTSYITLSA